MSNPLRVAILGSGKMGRQHAAAIRQLAGAAQVVAVVDPDEGARARMQEVWPDAAGYACAEEMFAACVLDVVHVCGPLATHEPLALLAIERGCHVYVEKPFATSAAAAQRVLAAARQRQVQVCAGHQLLFEEPARIAAELLPALGRLVHVESYFSFRTVRRSPDGRAPLRSDLQLLDILPHPLYLLLNFLEASAPGEALRVDHVTRGTHGTVHALLTRGRVVGSLVVTVEGRPVESYVRLVGTNGTVEADFVRGTVRRLLGPGTSGIDKALNPYRLSRQLGIGTTRALARRLLKRQRSYPGLAEIFSSFYRSIREGMSPAVSPQNIVDTCRIWDLVSHKLAEAHADDAMPDAAAPLVAVTGGTGFLGRATVAALLQRGFAVRILARRSPAPWERLPGADYRAVDLSTETPASALAGVDAIVHCAAATAGGWTEHQLHSLDATEHVLRAAAAAGVGRMVHVSSLAVLGGASGPIGDSSPLLADSRSRGPYVWGKLESERLATRLAGELGVELKIVRPGAIVDDRAFEPPGRLGKRLGNIFLAVGTPSERLGVVDLEFAAEMIAWIASHWSDAPPTLNVLTPTLPAKRELVAKLRKVNPDLRVLWMPRVALVPLSVLAVILQKLLRPGRPAVNVARVFAAERYDTSRIAALAQNVLHAASPSLREHAEPTRDAQFAADLR